MGYETLGLISKYIQWALGIAIGAITLVTYISRESQEPVNPH